jgi:hypothetical protein
VIRAEIYYTSALLLLFFLLFIYINELIIQKKITFDSKVCFVVYDLPLLELFEIYSL